MTNEPLIVLVAEDEYARYLGQPSRHTGKSPAVQWLEANFVFKWETDAWLDEKFFPGPLEIWPMIELLDQPGDDEDDDADGPMMIFPSDYDDPGRWWL